MFSVFFADRLLVCLLKVLRENDVAILTHCLHPSLQSGQQDSQDSQNRQQDSQDRQQDSQDRQQDSMLES